MTIEMKPQSKSITAGKNSDGTSRRPYKNKPLRRTKDENVAAASGHSRIDSGSIEDSSKSSPADILAEVFPTWNMDDLMAILTELDGDVELAITRISEGHAIQWSKAGERGTKAPPKQHQPRLFRSNHRSAGDGNTKGSFNQQQTQRTVSNRPAEKQTEISWNTGEVAVKEDSIGLSWNVSAGGEDSTFDTNKTDETTILKPKAEDILSWEVEPKNEVYSPKPSRLESPKQQRSPAKKNENIFLQEHSQESSLYNHPTNPSQFVPNQPVVEFPRIPSSRTAKTILEVEPTVVLLPISASVRSGINVSFGTKTSPAATSPRASAEPSVRPSLDTVSRYINMSVEAQDDEKPQAAHSPHSSFSPQSSFDHHQHQEQQQLFGGGGSNEYMASQQHPMQIQQQFPQQQQHQFFAQHFPYHGSSTGYPPQRSSDFGAGMMMTAPPPGLFGGYNHQHQQQQNHHMQHQSPHLPYGNFGSSNSSNIPSKFTGRNGTASAGVASSSFSPTSQQRTMHQNPHQMEGGSAYIDHQFSARPGRSAESAYMGSLGGMGNNSSNSNLSAHHQHLQQDYDPRNTNNLLNPPSNTYRYGSNTSNSVLYDGEDGYGSYNSNASPGFTHRYTSGYHPHHFQPQPPYTNSHQQPVQPQARPSTAAKMTAKPNSTAQSPNNNRMMHF